MKDVVTAARDPVLVTGFGPFPGAPSNPTLDMMRLLEAEGVAGLTLVLAPLPVTFAGVAPALRAAAAACRPRAILLLGLARRRCILSVETQACNHAGGAMPDADGCRPARARLVEDGPARIVARWPAAALRDRLRAAGHEAALSDDAGDYVCNAALYHALHERLAPILGFLHVPPLDGRRAEHTAETFADAARIVVAGMATGDESYSAARAG